MTPYKNIFEAIDADNIEAVKSFLPDQLMLHDKYGNTPLHIVCIFGIAELVNILLDGGADIEARNNFGWTPLIYASYHGKAEVIRPLLDRGADIDVKDNYGMASLHHVCHNSNTEDAINLLLDYGADIDTRDKLGRTPLHQSCIYERYKVSELLIKRGADPFIQDNEGKSALDYNHKSRQIFLQLREEYLNKQVLDKSNRTAAIKSGWEMEI